MSHYNFPVLASISEDGWYLKIIDRLRDVYKVNSTQSFKIVVKFSYILAHKETCKLRFFTFSNNTRLSRKPTQIDRQCRWDTFLKNSMTEANLVKCILKNIPDTKWVPIFGLKLF